MDASCATDAPAPPEPFDHPNWLYQVKFDGFRALAHLEPARRKSLQRASRVQIFGHQETAVLVIVD